MSQLYMFMWDISYILEIKELNKLAMSAIFDAFVFAHPSEVQT